MAEREREREELALINGRYGDLPRYRALGHTSIRRQMCARALFVPFDKLTAQLLMPSTGLGHT